MGSQRAAESAQLIASAETQSRGQIQKQHPTHARVRAPCVLGRHTSMQCPARNACPTSSRKEACAGRRWAPLQLCRSSACDGGACRRPAPAPAPPAGVWTSPQSPCPAHQAAAPARNSRYQGHERCQAVMGTAPRGHPAAARRQQQARAAGGSKAPRALRARPEGPAHVVALPLNGHVPKAAGHVEAPPPRDGRVAACLQVKLLPHLLAKLADADHVAPQLVQVLVLPPAQAKGGEGGRAKRAGRQATTVHKWVGRQRPGNGWSGCLPCRLRCSCRAPRDRRSSRQGMERSGG